MWALFNLYQPKDRPKKKITPTETVGTGEEKKTNNQWKSVCKIPTRSIELLTRTPKRERTTQKQKKTRDEAIQYGGPHKPRWLLGGWAVSDNGTPLIWENPHETKENSVKSRWGEVMRAGIRNDTNEKK
jgi:hypothetical protein